MDMGGGWMREIEDDKLKIIVTVFSIIGINLIFLPLQLYAYITCLFNGVRVTIQSLIFTLITYALIQVVALWGIRLVYKHTRLGKKYDLKVVTLFQLIVSLIAVSPVIKFQVMPLLSYNRIREETNLAHNYFQTSEMWGKVLLDTEEYRISYLEVDDAIHIMFKNVEKNIYICLSRSRKPVEVNINLFEKLTEEISLYRTEDTIAVMLSGAVYNEITRTTDIKSVIGP